jgi:phosphatidylglycerol:prolipoprotein diacylglycerol transferase
MAPQLSILAYFVDNLDPFIFKIGSWGPRWYGLAYLLGFLFAYLLIKKNSRDGMLRLNPERVADLVLNACIFGVLVGGRLGYCLFYQPKLLWFTSEFPYWGVLRVWEGGMSAHGGVVFTILTLMWFGWKYRKQGASIVNIGDAACMVVPIGLFFGRCANFINGELYGHPTTVPWAVKFPSEVYAPTNGVIDPAVADKLPGVFDALHLPINWISPGAFAEGKDMLDRLLIARDPKAVEAVAQILPPRHPSQLYEALLEGLLLFIICWTIGRKWRKDGMAGGAFLTFYPIMRIIGEQFRVGDTPVPIMGMQISKGILYSIPMCAIGVIYWVYMMRRKGANVWHPYAVEAPPEPPKPDHGSTPQ